jgi:hypothetical protein
MLSLACGQKDNLVLLETDSNFSSYAYYNESINSLLYFGVNVDKEGHIIESTISIKELTTGNERVIERQTGYPSIGWINDSSVLVYKIIDDGGSLLDQNYNRILYRFNVFNRHKSQIYDVPLDRTGSNMVVDDNIIVYKTGYSTSTRLFKYDLLTRKTLEVELVAGLSIDDGNFVYCAEKDLLAFVVFDDNVQTLKILMNDLLITVAVSKNHFTNLCFDNKNKMLYYVVGSENGNGQVVKRFDLNNSKTTAHYFAEAGNEILNMSPYKTGLLLSMYISGGSNSKHKLTFDNTESVISIDPRRKIYILEK